MRTQLFSLSKIFTEKLLRIPDYQRGYAWTEKQLKDFWNDLLQLEADNNHYTGVLTLEEVPDNIVEMWQEDLWIIRSKSYAPFYIVDGQQRLTTSIVLIQAITEIVASGTKLNYTSVDDIRKKYIYESKDEGISRSYIFGYEKDNPSYEFLKTKVFLERSDNSSTSRETIYTHNLRFAKSFFIEKLGHLTTDQIEDVYHKITQKFLFNIYSISEEVDVFVAFETMNNRGKALSHLELLKNRLIYLSTKFAGSQHDKSQLRHAINEAWKDVYYFLGKNKNNPLDDDLFLRHHCLYYFGKEYMKVMHHHDDDEFIYRRVDKVSYSDFLLDEKFTPKNMSDQHVSKTATNVSMADVHSYVQSMKESIELWYNLFNPVDSDFTAEEKIWIEKINRMSMSQVAPYIMAFYLRESSTVLRIKLLRLMEKALFISLFQGIHIFQFLQGAYVLTTSRNSANFQPSSDKMIKDLEAQIDTLVSKRLLSEYFITYFKQRGFYQWPAIRYFLFEYEQELKNSSKTSHSKLEWESLCREDSSDYCSVEHIYPQTPRNICWTSKFQQFSDRERHILKNSLGNLVPLSKPKNSSLQNKCFEDKKGNRDSQVGFRFGSFSEIEVANYDDWTAEHILNRGLKMLDFMVRRWKLDLGDRENKVKILGLDYVDRKIKVVKP